jgi:hypothetical protein
MMLLGVGQHSECLSGFDSHGAFVVYWNVSILTALTGRTSFATKKQRSDQKCCHF